MSEQMRAYFFLAMAMSIAGSAVVAGKLMVSTMPVFLAVELGILVSLLFLLPLAAVRRHRHGLPDGKTHLVLLMQAVCGIVLYRVFIFQGLQYTTAASSGLISSAAPALIALMAFFFLHEKMPVKRIAGVAGVTLGILVVSLSPFLEDSFHAAHAFKGNALILAAVLCESAFSVASKAGCRPMSALSRTAVVSFYAFLCLLPFALHDARNYDFSATSVPTVLCIGYYGFFVSFLSYVFWFKGIAAVPAGVAASFTGFVPLSGVLLSRVVLNEDISGAQGLGLFLVLMGIGLSCLPENALKSALRSIAAVGHPARSAGPAYGPPGRRLRMRPQTTLHALLPSDFSPADSRPTGPDRPAENPRQDCPRTSRRPQE